METKNTVVFVLVNTLTSVNAFVYQNHIHFFLHAKLMRPDLKFVFWTPNRMSIDRARNEAARLALEANADYLMFLDDDVLVPHDTLPKLLEAKKDIIAGLVIIRGFPFNVMAFKYNEERTKLDFFNNLPKDEKGKLIPQILPCDAVGFSCCLIDMEVIRAMEPPYFMTSFNTTEDVYFCERVRSELTPTPEIFLHTGIKCGHLMNAEPIEWDTIEAFRSLHVDLKAIDEELTGNNVVKHEGRDLEYITKCLAQL